jgi:hypothetical protein
MLDKIYKNPQTLKKLREGPIGNYIGFSQHQEQSLSSK